MTCTVHKELVKELNLKQVTNDFVDGDIGPLFNIAEIDVDECLTLSLNIKSCAIISDQNRYIFSAEL